MCITYVMVSHFIPIYIKVYMFNVFDSIYVLIQQCAFPLDLIMLCKHLTRRINLEFIEETLIQFYLVVSTIYS